MPTDGRIPHQRRDFLLQGGHLVRYGIHKVRILAILLSHFLGHLRVQRQELDELQRLLRIFGLAAYSERT
ncbi:hypothetical protein D3C84_1221810 [compost metagenome]